MCINHCVLRSLSITFILLYDVFGFPTPKVPSVSGNSRARGEGCSVFFFNDHYTPLCNGYRHFSRPFQSELDTMAVVKGRLNYLNVIDLTHKQQLNKWVAAGSVQRWWWQYIQNRALAFKTHIIWPDAIYMIKGVKFLKPIWFRKRAVE